MVLFYILLWRIFVQNGPKQALYFFARELVDFSTRLAGMARRLVHPFHQLLDLPGRLLHSVRELSGRSIMLVAPFHQLSGTSGRLVDFSREFPDLSRSFPEMARRLVREMHKFYGEKIILSGKSREFVERIWELLERARELVEEMLMFAGKIKELAGDSLVLMGGVRELSAGLLVFSGVFGELVIFTDQPSGRFRQSSDAIYVLPDLSGKPLIA